MLKRIHRTACIGLLFSLMTLATAWAQTKVSGKVSDNAGLPIPGASLMIKGRVAGTVTDTKGNFSLSTNTPAPFVLVVTSVGFGTQEVNVTGNTSTINVRLEEQALQGQEIVVSASRVEESVMKSPVSVEKLDLRAIQNSPAIDFYGSLANLKGIDVATQGLLFKSINMRGFGATGNPRTVQLIDGMDNSAPGLNFPIDNIAGIPEQDIESVEILPGAASALYGPNAIQGLILMNSKSPFLYQGLSANVKTGMMSASNRDVVNTGYYDASIRYAKAFNNKFAFKLNLSYLQAKDWQATNYDNLNGGGSSDPNRGPGTAPNYDGMNVYGDENQQNLRSITSAVASNTATPANVRTLLNSALNGNLVPNSNVSRTGYIERDLVDYDTKSLKINGALHYRITDKIEAIGQVNYGFGTTVYTANGRYSLRDFSLTQAKLELRGDNFTVRAYTTQERSGKSYTAGLTSIFMNEAWKPSTAWFPQYAVGYAAARAGGQTDELAHLSGRAAADAGRPIPGTDAYNTLFERARTSSISSNAGGAFLDKSNLYHAEGVYNFKNQIKAVDLLVGANVRQYQLGSEGTLFADQQEGRTGKININEYGAFAQASKSLFNDHLKLTASTRYDKNQNFKGQFTPRVTAVATFGEHNIRLSYQTGFRIPTTQNQYIDLQTPQARLIGGLPEFFNRYNLANSYPRTNVAAAGAAIAANTTNADFIAQQRAILTTAVTPAVTAGVTQQVTVGVTAQVTAGVTAQVNALVAAGQLPAANAAAAIQQGVAAQLASPQVQGLIQQTIAANLPGAINSTVNTNLSGFVQLQAVRANTGNLKPYQRKEFRPERVQSYEIGYRSVIAKKLFVDAYYYYSVYQDFIGSVILLQPTGPLVAGQQLSDATGVFGGGTRRAFSAPANSSERITASGWAIGLNYALPKGYVLSGNLANNELNNFTPSDELQTSGFNTPKYRWNVAFAKRPTNNSLFGYAVSFKQQDAFIWEGFGQPTEVGVPLYDKAIVPAISNLDAQVNYKVSSLKSIIKVGATNLFGKPYVQAYGNPSVGTTYYLSISFDELMR